MNIKLVLRLLLSCFILSFPIFADSNSPKPFIVVLDWFINPNHAPLLIAQEKGYFQRQGLTVKLIAPADPNDGPKLVAAKQANIAITYQPQLLLQIDKGLPLMRFATLINTPLSCLVTLKANNINKIEDLKGKTVGYSSGAIDSAMMQTMLRAHGLTLKDIKFINVRYDLVQALLSKNIDAFTGGMRNFEPIQLDQSEHPAKVFYPEKNGFPSYDELIFVVNRDAIGDPQLVKFQLALQQAISYLKSYPQESWDIVVKKYPELNTPSNKVSWFASIQYFSQAPGKFDQNRYQALANFMHDQGLINRVPELNSYAIELNSGH